MDLEFEAASKRLAKERADRQREISRRKRREKEVAAAAEASLERVKAKAERLRQQREEEKAARQENVDSKSRFERDLRCEPLAKADTNRVVLPPSALADLNSYLQSNEGNGPLTFELSIGDRKTHSGVDSFTAEEGTVLIPPAVALSLTREQGVDWLTNQSVKVRLVDLPKFQDVKVAFEPRGDGFHVSGEQVVNIDIKSVLLRTLRDSLTLTQGDWIPLRHGGQTYELVVKSISPEPAVLLVDTDVEVDLLPSENEMRRQEEIKKREEWVENRKEWISSLRDSLSEEEPTQEVVTIRVRLMDGKSMTRKFSQMDKLGKVLDWVEVHLPQPEVECIPSDGYHIPFVLIRSGFGARQTFGDNSRERSLKELDIVSESLMVNWLSAKEQEELEQEELEQEGDVDMADAPPAKAFSAAIEAAEKDLDRTLEQTELEKAMEESLRGNAEDDEQTKVDKVHVFHSLVAQGILPHKAATAAQNFSKQIVTLETMGFQEHAKSIELLEKYQGRLERVVNLLAGGD